jgi:hypothetical protein
VAGVLKEGVSSNSILETLIWLKLVKKPSRNVVVRGEKALCEKYNDEMLENVIEHLM